MHGPWFVQGDWVCDLAALNKMELLPWDCWGLGDIGPQAAASAQDMALLDRVAVLTLADVGSFPEMRALYESDDRLRVPPSSKATQMQALERSRSPTNSQHLPAGHKPAGRCF